MKVNKNGFIELFLMAINHKTDKTNEKMHRMITLCLIVVIVLCMCLATSLAESGFLLSYDGNGHPLPEGLTSQAIISGSPTCIYQNYWPEDKYYTFLGWSTDPSATEPEYQPGDYYLGEESATLYAIWKGTVDLGEITESASFTCDALPRSDHSWFSFTVSESALHSHP